MTDENLPCHLKNVRRHNRGHGLILASCVWLALMLHPAAAQETTGPKWGPHIDLEVKPGTRRSLGELDYFLPLSQDGRTLYFANLRGRFANGGNQEGNFGLGMRRMMDEGWNFGAYAYLDRRRSEQGNYFSQATIGLEALGRDFDLRGNVYIPFGSKSHSLGTISNGSPTANLVGTTVQITSPGSTTWEERALTGYDAEAGWRLPVFDVEDKQQLRLYLGGYHFRGGGVVLSGPRARLELSLSKVRLLGRETEVFVSAETQRDNPRGSQSFLALRLRIPLGDTASQRAPMSWQTRRMTAPIVRDVDIVTQRRVASSTPSSVETATATATGQAFSVVDSATTSGAGLQSALNAAGSDSTVILAGTFDTTSTLSMSNGQTILGNGALAVRGASGTTAILQLPGATIAASGVQSAIQMANNATLDGLTITNTYNAAGANGVNAQSLSGASVRNSTITVNGTGGVYALDIRMTSNASVVGNTITAISPSSGANGIYAQSANNLTVAGNTFISSTSSSARYAIAGNNFTSFASGSSGNVSIGGTCSFSGGTPSGSVGFSSISCP